MSPDPRPAAEVLAPWLRHGDLCAMRGGYPISYGCTCGLGAALAALAPEGVVTLNGKRWRVVRFTSDSGGKDARLVPYRPEDTNG